MKGIRKILLWTAGAVLLLLVIAAVALPRLVNTDAVKNAIEGTISRELGGTMTYDRVVLSILPRPRIVLNRPKIDIPRKVSAALESVEIYPAILPLLTGEIQVRDVRLENPVVTVLLPEVPSGKKVKQRPAAAASGPTADAILGVAARHLPDIEIAMDGGGIAVKRDGQQILSVRDLRARIAFLSEATGTDRAASAAENAFLLSGSIAGSIDSPDLPMGPVVLTVSRFEATPGTVSLSRATVSVSDLSLTLSGRVENYLSARQRADIDLAGTAGPNVVQWLRDTVPLSPLLTPRTPLSLSNTSIRWEPGALQAAGRAAVKGGTALDFDVRVSTGDIFVKRIAVRDGESQATLSLHMNKRISDLSFAGTVSSRTLDGLFGHERFPFGWIKGDIKVRLPLDRIADASAEGVLETERIVVPWKSMVPFTIDRLMLTAHGRDVKLEPAAVTLGSSKGVFTGTVSARDDGLALDLDLASPEVVWDDLQELFLPKDVSEGTSKHGGETAEKPKREPLPVRGTLRLNVDALRGKRFVFQPVRGTITFDRDGTKYEVNETSACGIGVAGTVVVSRGATDLSLDVSAKEQDLAPTLTCLAGEDLKITGNFDLTGSIAGRGPNKTLMRSLAGKISFVARNGRIYNDVLVVPILKYKKISDLLGDKVADARKNGIPYDTWGLRGDLQNQMLTVKEGVVKSRLLNLAANGTIDLVNDRLDITVLIAPFKNVDAVVKRIPLLGDILGGTLVTVPLRVQGPFKDPKVTPLPPSAISEGLMGIMKRTLEVPFQVVDDVSPRKRPAATPTTP